MKINVNHVRESACTAAYTKYILDTHIAIYEYPGIGFVVHDELRSDSCGDYRLYDDLTHPIYFPIHFTSADYTIFDTLEGAVNAYERWRERQSPCCAQ